MSNSVGGNVARVLTGLDIVLRDGLSLPGQGRIGLLGNSSAVARDYRNAPEALRELPGVRLTRVFSPQHGFAGEKQDNMIESGDGIHRRTGVPLISLYGRVREPEPEMLGGLDALVIDLPDVGTRVYTFLSTALLCVRACARAGLPVIVLDRPNPIGGAAVEGPQIEPSCESFVGLLPVPLRHGLTAGEALRFASASLNLELDLRVVPLEGWRREMLFPETGLPWILPSPNLPTWEGCLVYPGMVLFEGTNISEGRGTTRPFEIFGAPWLDPASLLDQLGGATHGPGIRREEGFLLRETAFRPTFHKYAGQTSRGFQIHPLDPVRFRPVATAVRLLAAIRRCHPQEFAWKQPPYEYEYQRSPIDLIAGTGLLRAVVEGELDLPGFLDRLEAEGQAFRSRREPFLLYG